MKLISQNIKIVVVLSAILILVLNHKVIAFGFENDFFGMFFSLVLFFFGARKTTIKVNYLLIGLLLLFEFISYRLHTKSLHFLSLIFLICLIYYEFTKKFSFIALICLLLFSTVFNKFFEHLSTEIKQALCENVYLVLKNFMDIEKIEGVNFFINGAKVTVDNACMGLSMFKTGFLIGAILLIIEEQKQKRFFSIVQIISFCLVIVVLNVVSNYFRITILILLNCTEENTLHDAIGLICFVMYQVLPMLLLIRYLKPKSNGVEVVQSLSNYVLIAFSFLIIGITSFEMRNDTNFYLLDNLNPKYEIQNGKWLNKEVFKIDTNETLIYIKSPSHKPLICWTGTGYNIIESKEIVVNYEKIWYNKMEKNNVNYKSLWWYECNGKKYTSFVEVMLTRLIYGKPIRLINETSIID
jgi:exosortase N